jgi:SRSO17 transposase
MTRFAARRLSFRRTSHSKRSEPAPEEWPLIAWPEGGAEPDHYWLSILPADISFECMIDLI